MRMILMAPVIVIAIKGRFLFRIFTIQKLIVA